MVLENEFASLFIMNFRISLGKTCCIGVACLLYSYIEAVLWWLVDVDFVHLIVVAVSTNYD